MDLVHAQNTWRRYNRCPQVSLTRNDDAERVYCFMFSVGSSVGGSVGVGVSGGPCRSAAQSTTYCGIE